MRIYQAEIRTLIPHAGLMCLLDEVTRWDERSIVCISNTHRDPTNPLRRQGHACRRCTLSNMARKRPLCTAVCELARQARLPRQGISLRCGEGGCT